MMCDCCCLFSSSAALNEADIDPQQLQRYSAKSRNLEKSEFGEKNPTLGVEFSAWLAIMVSKRIVED